MNPTFLDAILKNNIEASRYGCEKLVTGLESVSPPFKSSRNIVKIKHSSYVKGHVASGLDDSEATPVVGDLGKIDYSTCFKGHPLSLRWLDPI
jgi:hypothetical protein